MDREARQATVYGVTKELDTTKQQQKYLRIYIAYFRAIKRHFVGIIVTHFCLKVDVNLIHKVRFSFNIKICLSFPFILPEYVISVLFKDKYRTKFAFKKKKILAISLGVCFSFGKKTSVESLCTE